MLWSNRNLQADIEAFDIRELTPKFDVILLEPPLEEYYRETGIMLMRNAGLGIVYDEFFFIIMNYLFFK